ncbi:hypothetical protein [Actinoalloteichus sp. GBA129-24]|uniref:hypothetical protein n=1 Tax=Actinoalloteichus sp. GBA129-24 TaxID=1612551 RepID=UPI000950A5AF|nr:hypothetical protein [Actinoalloteichus sp. GBA129-24]APU21301.1 hypothetical protein UA75_16465 [Actinoalloteichus sp. GBA129-24]
MVPQKEVFTLTTFEITLVHRFDQFDPRCFDDWFTMVAETFYDNSTITDQALSTSLDVHEVELSMTVTAEHDHAAAIIAITATHDALNTAASGIVTMHEGFALTLTVADEDNPTGQDKT